MTENDGMRGAPPGKKVPAPRKLVIGGETICEEGELLTREEFGERVGRALRRSAGLAGKPPTSKQ